MKRNKAGINIYRKNQYFFVFPYGDTYMVIKNDKSSHYIRSNGQYRIGISIWKRIK